MSVMIIQAIMLIVQVLVGFMSFLLLARFTMQLCRVSFNNQIGYFVMQLTNWLVLPLRKVIPGVWGLDLASLVPVFLLQIIETLIVIALHGFLVQGGTVGLLTMLLGLSFIAFLRTCLYFLMFLLLAQAVISWINPYSPAYPVLSAMTAPILRPIQRIVPLVGRIDLSPLVAILLIQVLLVFVR